MASISPGPAFRLLDQIYFRRLRASDRRRRADLDAYHPRLLAAFDTIEESTGKRGLYVAKSFDLLRLLERARPASIIELGTGRTTVIFAAYAARTGAAFTAFEQDPAWIDLMRQVLAPITSRDPIVHSPVEDRPLGARFTTQVPDADMVYVDAPYRSGGGPFATHTGKPAYSDVPDHLRGGGAPKTIVVDGRTDTVDLIRLAAPDYRFTGGYDWARERGELRHGLTFARHSLFERT